MTSGCTPFEALQAAVAKLGSQAAMAKVCGVSQPGVWKWLQSSKRLPAEHVIAVEAASGVSRHDLRPDIYPLEHSGNPTAIPASPSAVGDCGPIVACDRPALSKRAAAR